MSWWKTVRRSTRRWVFERRVGAGPDLRNWKASAGRRWLSDLTSLLLNCHSPLDLKALWGCSVTYGSTIHLDAVVGTSYQFSDLHNEGRGE